MIPSGLIKSVIEEPDGYGRMKVTTRIYDPESTPPVLISEEIEYVRTEQP